MRVTGVSGMATVVALALLASCGQAPQVACRSNEAHGDYFGSEGLFDTPAAALTDVLSGTGAEVGDYAREDTGPGRVSYRYTATAVEPHTWDVWNEGEGWFVQSVEGCLDVVLPT